MSEDQEWSRRVLLAGFGSSTSREAAVHHSHAYSLARRLRRFFDSGASAERSYVDGARVDGARLRRPVLRYAPGELRGCGRRDSDAGSRTRPPTSSRSSRGSSSDDGTVSFRPQ